MSASVELVLGSIQDGGRYSLVFGVKFVKSSLVTINLSCMHASTCHTVMYANRWNHFTLCPLIDLIVILYNDNILVVLWFTFSGVFYRMMMK